MTVRPPLAFLSCSGHGQVQILLRILVASLACICSVRKRKKKICGFVVEAQHACLASPTRPLMGQIQIQTTVPSFVSHVTPPPPHKRNNK